MLDSALQIPVGLSGSKIDLVISLEVIVGKSHNSWHRSRSLQIGLIVERFLVHNNVVHLLLQSVVPGNVVSEANSVR